ncbi:MAG: CotH kinase family protein [Prevotella sp.]|nr:CotH kinase family protein [Prevotella sp.]
MKTITILARKLKKYYPPQFVVLLLAFTAGLLTACSDDTEDEVSAQLHLLTLDEVNTGLPKVVINTPDHVAITDKSKWMDNVEMTIYKADGTIEYQGTLQAKGRGNSTWGFPKKPYALKLDKKASILGMPKHKRWCLLANWVDRTLIRNAVGFEIARQMNSLAYTPRGEFVELFLNGRFEGNYYLCEQIKVDENRVDIVELDEDATSGVGITGGYILEVDDHFDEDFRFVSSRGNMPWQCKDPDEVNPEQFAYVQHFVNEMEDALYDDARFVKRDFVKYLNLETFADWWLVMELTSNIEANGPKSCIMHKDMDKADGTLSKLCAGPVWDFDYNTFKPERSNEYAIINSFYYQRLFRDNQFRQIVKQRWAALKATGIALYISQYIDTLRDRLEPSASLNYAMWPPTLFVNGDTYLNYHDAVSRLKTSFLRKYTYLDHAIDKL